MRLTAAISSWLRRRWTWAALAGVLAAHLLVNVCWLQLDRSLRAEDQGTQLAAAASAHHVLITRGPAGAVDVLRGLVGTNQPGAGYLVWAVISLLVGQSLVSLRLQNMLYLALLLGATQYIGLRMHSARAGLLAAVLLSLYPGIFGASRQFGADFPAAAMVALGVALLLASRQYARSGRSLLLGLVMGLGLLVRPHTLFFLVPVCVTAGLWALWRPAGVSRLRLAVNLGLAAAAALGTSSLWWAGRLGQIHATWAQHQQGQLKLQWMEQPSILYYLQHLPLATTPFLLGVFGLSLVGVFWPGRAPWCSASRRPLWLVGAWLVLGLAVLAQIEVHMLRYAFALLPALALLSAHGLCSLPHRRSRRIKIGVVLVTGAASWLLCSFAVDSPSAATPGSEEACTLCGSWRYGGPPDSDPIYLTAGRVADLLVRAHGDGRGVVVRLPVDFTSPEDQGILHAFVMANTMLMVRLPHLIVEGRPWSRANVASREDDPVHGHFWGLSCARTAAPYRHCYTLSIRQSSRPAREVTGTRLLYEEMESGDPLRIALWRHPRCPVP